MDILGLYVEKRLEIREIFDAAQEEKTKMNTPAEVNSKRFQNHDRVPFFLAFLRHQE